MIIPANNLRRFRKEKGLSLRNVADVLGMSSTSTLSRWESGVKRPSATRALELSALYQRLVNELLWNEFQDARTRVRSRLKACRLLNKP